MIMFWLKILAVGGLLSTVGMAGAYFKGKWDCAEAAQVAQLEADKRELLAELARREARTAADNEARERDRSEREQFDEATEDATNDPEGTDNLDEPLLDERITRRLRELWR